MMQITNDKHNNKILI